MRRVRLPVVVDGRMVVRRRRWAREGRRWLCVEVSGGILVKGLELFALVVVEGILSKACVSPCVQQERAASLTGCRERQGERGEKRVRQEPHQVQVHCRETTDALLKDTYRRRGVVEVLGGGGVGMRGRQRSDAQRELVIGRRLRRRCEIRSVLRVVHFEAATLVLRPVSVFVALESPEAVGSPRADEQQQQQLNKTESASCRSGRVGIWSGSVQSGAASPIAAWRSAFKMEECEENW